MSKEHRTPASMTSTTAGGSMGASSGGGTTPRMDGPAGHAAGIQQSARQSTGEPPHPQASFEEYRRAVRHTTMSFPKAAHARPELDPSFVGRYMRAAIARGGYRKALEYYGGDECKKSDTPRHRLRAWGWLLGRLGLYGQMKRWLEEAAAWDDFDHLLAAASSGVSTNYRTPSLWLETPRPVSYSASDIITLEPAAAPCRDTGAVPGGIWTVMMILDAAGPICSHAGLGAALSLVEAGAARQAADPVRGECRYDPRRGARLHGAPEGCHRWIIADVDFDPWPPHGPHYYYDLTDEGRGALADARAAGAPWNRATEDAAAALAGMELPDLLENACKGSRSLPSLDGARADLGRVVDAWRALDDGRPAPPVSAEDQALVDLERTADWPETDNGASPLLDNFLHLVSVIDATSTIAGEADPTAGAERAVVQTLVAAIQGMCRERGWTVAASVAASGPSRAAARGNSERQVEDAQQRPLYTDAAAAAISDLYYCLAEYCKSRRLATDPCSLPLYERFDDEERAVVIKALQEGSRHSGAG